VDRGVAFSGDGLRLVALSGTALKIFTVAP
jgi:hypothetical protein